MTFSHAGMSIFNVMMGGPTMRATFPLDNFFRLEDRVNGEASEVTVEVNPNKIIFLNNKGVSGWVPITNQFKDVHISNGATVRWDSNQVLTRFRLKSNLVNDSTTKPILLLEALVLSSGTWSAVPKTAQMTLSANSSSAIRLWSQDCVWISPLPTNMLPTVAGICRLTFDVTRPSELIYRWYLQAILRRMDEGSSLPDRESYNAYMLEPFLVKAANPITCWLPDPYYNFRVPNSGYSDQQAFPCQMTEDKFAANIAAVQKITKSVMHPAQDNVSFSAANRSVSTPVTSISVVRETLGQEVTQYCPMGCGWLSYKSHDKAMLDSCIKQLQLHLLTDHGVSGSGTGDAIPNSKGDKSYREYLAATKPKTVTDVIDDATYNLCSARFFAAPLDIKVLGMKMPVCTSPINTVVDLSHIGVDVTNPDTLRKIQNRASVQFKLRDFSEPNLRSHQTPGDELVAVQHTKDHLYMSKKIKNLENPTDCLKAFFNYCILAQNFHVLDWSPHALMKVVLEKYATGLPTVEMYERLFEKFIHENAVRAQKRAVPLTYQEILTKYNTTIASPAVNLSSIKSIVRREMQNAAKNPNNLNRSQERGAGRDGVSSPNKKVRLTKDDYCPHFNRNEEKPFCPNPGTKEGNGCTVDGKEFKHACSKKVGSKFCGSSRHNIFNH